MHNMGLFVFFDFPNGSDGKESVYNAGDLGSIPGWEGSLEKEMATHSSTLAYKIPWTEEPGAGYCPWGRKELDMTEKLHFLSITLMSSKLEMTVPQFNVGLIFVFLYYCQKSKFFLIL